MGRKQTILICTFIVLSFGFIHAQFRYTVSRWVENGAGVMKQSTPHFYIEIYNSDSLLVEKRTSISDDSSYDRVVFEYNDKKQKISETKYQFRNRLVTKRNFDYDEAGRLHSMKFDTRNKPAEKIRVTETYFYNEAGQPIRMVKSETALDSFARFCCGPPEITSFEYKKTPKGLMVTQRTQYREKGRAHKTKVTTYNEKGEVTREWTRDNEYSYDYEYDDRGQWIKIRVCERISKISPWMCKEELRRSISRLQ